jgi:hypothetical protein
LLQGFVPALDHRVGEWQAVLIHHQHVQVGDGAQWRERAGQQQASTQEWDE